MLKMLKNQQFFLHQKKRKDKVLPPKTGRAGRQMQARCPHEQRPEAVHHGNQPGQGGLNSHRIAGAHRVVDNSESEKLQGDPVIGGDGVPTML